MGTLAFVRGLSDVSSLRHRGTVACMREDPGDSIQANPAERSGGNFFRSRDPMKRVSNATHVQKQNKQWAACPSSFMHTKTSLVPECPRFAHPPFAFHAATTGTPCTAPSPRADGRPSAQPGSKTSGPRRGPLIFHGAERASLIKSRGGASGSASRGRNELPAAGSSCLPKSGIKYSASAGLLGRRRRSRPQN